MTLEELKKKYPDKKYLKLTGGEMLNEDTCFSKYSFINNNSPFGKIRRAKTIRGTTLVRGPLTQSRLRSSLPS